MFVNVAFCKIVLITSESNDSEFSAAIFYFQSYDVKY